MYEYINLKRDTEAIEIPAGTVRILPALTRVRVSQFLGSGYTIITDAGYMCRIDSKDADALGFALPAVEQKTAGVFTEQLVWDQLKTVFDPEIPVNIVDLGLIYSCGILDHEDGGKRIGVKADVETKLRRLPEVKDVQVEVVFDPPWHAGLMSEAAKLQLGFDLDYGSPTVGITR
jgi:metal-sulfur cluster biosynthetic enzyme